MILDDIFLFVKQNLFLIIAIILILLYFKPFRQQKTEQFDSDDGTGYIDPYEASKPTRTLYLFYSPRCPHCNVLIQSQDSVWNKIIAKHNGRSDLNISTVNCDKNPKIAKDYNIQSFPTIMMETDADRVEFNGNRTFDDIEKFIQNVY